MFSGMDPPFFMASCGGIACGRLAAIIPKKKLLKVCILFTNQSNFVLVYVYIYICYMYIYYIYIYTYYAYYIYLYVQIWLHTHTHITICVYIYMYLYLYMYSLLYIYIYPIFNHLIWSQRWSPKNAGAYHVPHIGTWAAFPPKGQ